MEKNLDSSREVCNFVFISFNLMRLKPLKTVLWVLVCLSGMAVSACADPPISERMSSLAEYCENMDSFQEDDLDAVKDEYEMLLGEFRANLASYSQEEKASVY